MIFTSSALSRVTTGPGVPAGTRVKEQVRTIDLAPTLLDLLGGTVPSEVQGVSLVTSLRGHGEEAKNAVQRMSLRVVK